MSVAFFDLDNTLVKGSSMFYFAKHLVKQGFFTKRELAKFATAQARFIRTRTEDKRIQEIITEKALKLVAGREQSELIQFTVPADVWQAGEIVKGGEWGLFGCTMSPGFSGDIFEGGYYSDLIKDFPDRKEDILKLSVPAEHDKNMPQGYEN